MQIANNKVVELMYELRLDNADSEAFETTTPENPFVFLFGANNVLPDFETHLIGLKAGDKFSFSIKSEDGYGEYDEEAIVELPKNIFEFEGKLDENMVKAGNVLPMRDQDGHAMNGTVVEVKSDVVVMNFNHPLAGKDLFFSGTIASVREATEEELDHGHVHGPHGHHH